MQLAQRFPAYMPGGQAGPTVGVWGGGAGSGRFMPPTVPPSTSRSTTPFAVTPPTMSTTYGGYAFSGAPSAPSSQAASYAPVSSLYSSPPLASPPVVSPASSPRPLRSGMSGLSGSHRAAGLGALSQGGSHTGLVGGLLSVGTTSVSSVAPAGIEPLAPNWQMPASIGEETRGLAAMRTFVDRVCVQSLGKTAEDARVVQQSLEVAGYTTIASLACLDQSAAQTLQIPLRFIVAMQDELGQVQDGHPPLPQKAPLLRLQRTIDPGIHSDPSLKGHGCGSREVGKTGHFDDAPASSPSSSRHAPGERAQKSHTAFERHLRRHKMARQAKIQDLQGMRISKNRWERLDDPWLHSSEAIRCRRPVICTSPSPTRGTAVAPASPRQRSPGRPHPSGSPRGSPSTSSAEMRNQARGIKNQKLAGHVWQRVMENLATVPCSDRPHCHGVLAHESTDFTVGVANNGLGAGLEPPSGQAARLVDPSQLSDADAAAWHEARSEEMEQLLKQARAQHLETLRNQQSIMPKESPVRSPESRDTARVVPEGPLQRDP